LTIGLQFGFRTFLWLSAVPPIFLILAFKIYIDRTYLHAFNYFNPTEEEIRVARVYSERSDAQGNKLEKRFGHPGLHAELFTPMLHKKMMPLLSQIYHGRINNDHAKLDEYGGQKMEAQVVPGGIKIVAIHQDDLMYDPELYRRDRGDRGELDSDQRSVALTLLDKDASPIPSSRSQYFAGASSNPMANYDAYANHGPIELSPMDPLHEPLLKQGLISQQSFGAGSPPSSYSHNNTSSISREVPFIGRNSGVTHQARVIFLMHHSSVLSHRFTLDKVAKTSLHLLSLGIEHRLLSPTPLRFREGNRLDLTCIRPSSHLTWLDVGCLEGTNQFFTFPMFLAGLANDIYIHGLRSHN